MNCAHCEDTGSLSKSLDGYLDCGHCDIAAKRVELERWYIAQTKKDGIYGALWRLHQKLTNELQGEAA